MSDQTGQKELAQYKHEIAMLRMQLHAVHMAFERQSQVSAHGTAATEDGRELRVYRAFLRRLRQSRPGKWLLSLLVRRWPRQQKQYLSLIQQSSFFQADWYLRQYPEVKALAMTAQSHYLLFGGLAGYDPGPEFCSAFYLGNYPDVAQSQMNPLLHYLRFGRAEGRTIQPSQHTN